MKVKNLLSPWHWHGMAVLYTVFCLMEKKTLSGKLFYTQAGLIRKRNSNFYFLFAFLDKKNLPKRDLLVMEMNALLEKQILLELTPI